MCSYHLYQMIDDASSIQYVAHAAVAMLHTHMQEMFLRGLGIFRYIFKRTLKAPADCEYRIEVMAGLKKAWASPSEDILQDEWILVCLLKGLDSSTFAPSHTMFCSSPQVHIVQFIAPQDVVLTYPLQCCEPDPFLPQG